VTVEITLEVSNALLRKATELRMSDCYGAMSIANVLGGSPSHEWDLARKYRLADLVAEALDRGLPVGEFRSAVEGKRLIDCRCYLRLKEEIGGRPDFPW
jgi:hypothetical protein